jgi:hypothetical protein
MISWGLFEMIDLDTIPKTYDEAVESLAAWHYDDKSDMEVFVMADPDRKTVCLVEVSDDVGDDDNPRPIRMGTSADFPFSSSILLLSVSDWERINAGQLSLPEGWILERLRKLY